MEQENIKLDLMHIEDGVAWFENVMSGFSADLPTSYSSEGRTFEIAENSEVLFCRDEEGHCIIAKGENKVLVLFLERTDMGYEIQDVHILNMVRSH